MDVDRTGVRLSTTSRDGATVVTVTGLLDLPSCPDLRDGLLKIAAESPGGVVADIDALRIRDRALMSVFSVVAKRIGDRPGISFALVTRQPGHRAMLAARSVNRFVPVYPDVTAALAAPAPPRNRRATRSIGRSDGAEREAREFVRSVCAEWSVPDLTDDAALIVTELVGNVVRHTTSLPRLRLELRTGILTVSVADDDPRPAAQREQVRAFGPGVGLRMVAQLSKAWGCSATAEGGKVVWAALTA
ncbi:ATP-binding protein [Amycolatopsis samaneae]|uniref:ATP-binding protein n=1 Tax=Amycolatopsis samaneae TaxID=664691 RepID=A0ABW5GXD3_9PSEU